MSKGNKSAIRQTHKDIVIYQAYYFFSFLLDSDECAQAGIEHCPTSCRDTLRFLDALCVLFFSFLKIHLFSSLF